MDLRLSGKTAIVTGASRGIGLAITRGLIGEGVRVVAAARDGADEMRELGADQLLQGTVEGDRPARSPGQHGKPRAGGH
jgi:NAD(P)-dependent dehydrogenase (short-subunit alcohol dehydrogenase family)